MNLLFSLLAGLVFGLGLIVAGMANPAKVLGFLDIGGLWDPSLALVMAAAVVVATLGFAWAKKRKTSLLGYPLQLPTSTHIDRRLIGGSMLFGIGWGLAGICPGPALVLLGAGMYKGIIFAAAMVAGMAIFSLIERYRQS
ncbi:DUF6691 family protein [Yersinia enterocolitica]